jgi:hypothetical protein
MVDACLLCSCIEPDTSALPSGVLMISCKAARVKVGTAGWVCFAMWTISGWLTAGRLSAAFPPIRRHARKPHDPSTKPEGLDSHLARCGHIMQVGVLTRQSPGGWVAARTKSSPLTRAESGNGLLAAMVPAGELAVGGRGRTKGSRQSRNWVRCKPPQAHAGDGGVSKFHPGPPTCMSQKNYPEKIPEIHVWKLF